MPIKITLNAAAVKAISEAAQRGEPVTLQIDSTAIEKAAGTLTAMFDKIGKAAERINAAGSPDVQRAQRSLRSWGAASFAALLGMIGPILRGQRPPQ